MYHKSNIIKTPTKDIALRYTGNVCTICPICFSGFYVEDSQYYPHCKNCGKTKLAGQRKKYNRMRADRESSEKNGENGEETEI